MRVLAFLILGLLAALPLWAGPLVVAASTTDLAAIAREVGGDKVSVESMCRGDQDPHEFDVLPNQMGFVQKADVYLRVGLALDEWSGRLISGSGNSDIIRVDCSQGINVLGADGGGAHPMGNPHYWLAPSNLPRIAESIRDGFVRADPADSAYYNLRLTEFTAKADSAFAAWKSMLEPCRGRSIVSGHSTWDYFARDFGLRIAGIVSRIPEAEPTPLELARLEQAIRDQKAVAFLREPFDSDHIAQVLNRDTGIRILLAPTSVGAVPGRSDIWSHFQELVSGLAGACAASH